MACNMLDSMLYRNSYSTPKMREIFDDVAMIQNILDIEAALAETQAKMRADLDILKGLMQSEGIMLELGKYVGKQTAHGIVYQICMDTFEKKADFCDMLMKNETVAAHMTREQVQKILAPEGYVGLCGEICDQVVAHIRSDNEAKAKA